VLALVIWLLPSPEKMPLEELSPFQKEISEKAEEMNILPEHPVLPVEPVKKRIAKVLKWEKKAKLSAIVGEKETIREDEKCETIEIIEKDAIAAIVEEPSAKEDASEDSTDIVVKRGDSTVPLPEGERSPRRKASLKKKAKKSKRNKWLLAAAVGSSGYVDSFLNTDMSYGDVSSPGDMNVPSQDPDPNKPDKDDNEKENGNTPPQTASFRNAPVLRSSEVDENNRPTGLQWYINRYGKYTADFIQPESNYIYLTMDEGYEYGLTEGILDTLKEKNVKAVFFITLPYAKQNPELVQRMIDEGHVVGNHSVTHPSAGLSTLSVEQQINEVKEVNDYVLEHFGYQMYLFRFPTGAFSEQSLAIVQSQGYRSVFWSFAYKDWVVDEQPDVASSLANALNKVHGGAIYLLHAESTTNASMLADFIDGCRAKGFEFGYYSKVD